MIPNWTINAYTTVDDLPYIFMFCYVSLFSVWKLIGMVHSFADATVVTSPQIQDEFTHQQHIPRCFLWEKGIDTDVFHPDKTNCTMRDYMMGRRDHHASSLNTKIDRNEYNDNLFVMMYVGRLGPEKRLKDLRLMLDRMSTLLCEQKQDFQSKVRLCIVGDGPQRAELHQYFQNYIDQGIVKFTGSLHGEPLYQAYASADIFVMPSDSETLGFVVMESMASGVPVVAVNAGGIPDLIEHGRTGFLVNRTGDIHTFVEYILRLRDDVPLRNEFSKNGRSEMERWNWTKSMMKLRNEQYLVAQQNFHHRLEQRLIRCCQHLLSC
jgi:sulfoquinovosyltransferase